MIVLLDTNVLLRCVEPTHAHHAVALAAVGRLIGANETVCVVPQVMDEFWVVATRPVINNGLGWTPDEADRVLSTLERIYTLLPDKPDLYARWRRLVTTYRVSGKPAHDARLVAAMECHSVGTLVTFNTADFTRYGRMTLLSPGTARSPGRGGPVDNPAARAVPWRPCPRSPIGRPASRTGRRCSRWSRACRPACRSTRRSSTTNCGGDRAGTAAAGGRRSRPTASST